MILRTVLLLVVVGAGGGGAAYLPFADAEGMIKAVGAIGIGMVALIIALLIPKE